MNTLPIGIAVGDDVYTGRVVGTRAVGNASIDVHQLGSTRTACGLPGEEVPHRIAAGFAAVTALSWCPRCFPTSRVA